MRVIETFVKFVPREKIPADANWFAQGSIGGELLGSYDEEKPYNDAIWWISKGSFFGVQPIATDAAETVVTREELMRAYDLVEQGYTLWFGGECPVDEDTVVDVVWRDGREHHQVVAKKKTPFRSYFGTGYTVAYRLNRSVDKDVNRVTNARDSVPVLKVDSDAVTVASAIENNIKGRLRHGCDDDTSFPHPDHNQVCMGSDGKLKTSGNDLMVITRAQWDDYVSRKIRVGDKVKTHSCSEVEVLFVTDKTALVRYPKGAETSIALENLTRIPQ